MSRRLEVFLHDISIGALIEQNDGKVSFKFSDSYRDLFPRPVLGQKFEDDLERSYRSRRSGELPAFFANLIPEGRLREVIVKSAALEPADDLGLLSFVGRDLAGAIVVKPFEDDSWMPLDDFPDDDELFDAGMPEVDPGLLRFSLAGLQLKFSMLKEGKHLTLPAHGKEGEWIVKIPSPPYLDLPENEFSMLLWAERAGFDVPACSLHDTEDLLGVSALGVEPGQKAFAIQRFDRGAGGRIHQEDFAQAAGLPPELKYDHVRLDMMASLVRRFMNEEAVDELLRRITFVIATGNNDAHLKNWSLIYPDRIQARWSPLYDQISTVAWKEYDKRLALDLGGVKHFGQIDRSALLHFASKAGIEANRALEQVERTLERLRLAWPLVLSDAPLPEAHAEALREHWRRVPLLRESGGLERPL